MQSCVSYARFILQFWPSQAKVANRGKNVPSYVKNFGGRSHNETVTKMKDIKSVSDGSI